jgi:hypothetical protein
LSVYEQRLEAYARVLEAGPREDIVGLLNHTLLIGHWFDLWWRLGMQQLPGTRCISRTVDMCGHVITGPDTGRG